MLVLVSVGVIIYRSRSSEQTAKRTGVAVSAAAVLSLLTGAALFVLLSVTSVLPPAEGEIDPELVFAGIFSALKTAIVSLVLQSLELLAPGLALAWVGRGEPVRPPVPSDVPDDDEADSEKPVDGSSTRAMSVREQSLLCDIVSPVTRTHCGRGPYTSGCGSG